MFADRMWDKPSIYGSLPFPEESDAYLLDNEKSSSKCPKITLPRVMLFAVVVLFTTLVSCSHTLRPALSALNENPRRRSSKDSAILMFLKRNSAGQYFEGSNSLRDSADDDVLLAEAPAGKFIGVYGTDGMRIWKGIRYGQAPVNELRFKASVLAEPIPDTYTADSQPKYCVGAVTPMIHTSEDCLYLSITAPSEPAESSSGYAVMIYFFGGGFMTDYGANNPLSDMTYFAKNEVVGVNVNTRLGAFGFLTSSSLPGNAGFLDQRLAMQWVQQNIHAFGGDPTRVTIMGESSGAQCVGAHLASPGSNGLYHQAIMESDYLSVPFQTRNEAETVASYVFAAVNCNMDDLDCIRDVEWGDIYAAYKHIPPQQFPFLPIVEIDGEIPLQPYAALKSGAFATVPMLVGFNKQDGAYYEYSMYTTPLDYNSYQTSLEAKYGSDIVPQINQIYPWSSGNTSDGRVLAYEIFTDYGCACPTLDVFKDAVVSHGKGPVFMYQYSYGLPNRGSFKPCDDIACHGDELIMVFGSLNDYSFCHYNATPEQLAFSAKMNGVWSNFIKTGNPNSESSDTSSSAFIPYGADGVLLDLNIDGFQQITYARKEQCEYWDTYGTYPQ